MLSARAITAIETRSAPKIVVEENDIEIKFGDFRNDGD
jgi:hypothetical protein